MVVHGNRENLLSSVLTNNVLVEIVVHLWRGGREGGREREGGKEREREGRRERGREGGREGERELV